MKTSLFLSMEKWATCLLAVALISIYSCEKTPDTTNNTSNNNNNNSGTTVALPTAPSDLVLTVVSSKQVNLAWTDKSTNETGFKIERKTGSTVFQEIDMVGKDISTFSDMGVSPNTTYTYRVFAYNSAGNSLTYTNEATITTPGTPAAAANLKVYGVSNSTVIINWEDKATNETGYKVERKIAGGTYAEVATLGANTTSYTDGVYFGVLKENTTYYYRVYPYNALGNGAFSNEVMATTLGRIEIGQYYQGGVIFYVDATGKHGLVTALENLPSNTLEDPPLWGCFGTLTGANGPNVGDGARNTALIVSKCNLPGTAASVCDNYVSNGYSDWFLPNNAELSLLLSNLPRPNSIRLDIPYWTSTEQTSTNAFTGMLYFNQLSNSYTTSFSSVSKNTTKVLVRPIRAF